MPPSSIGPRSPVSAAPTQGQAQGAVEQNDASNLPAPPHPNAGIAVGAGDTADHLHSARDETLADMEAVAPAPLAQPRARHRRNNAMTEAELAPLLPPDIQMRIMLRNMPGLVPGLVPLVPLVALVPQVVSLAPHDPFVRHISVVN